MRLRLIETVVTYASRDKLVLTRRGIALRYQAKGDWESVSAMLLRGTTTRELESLLPANEVERLLQTVNTEGWLTTSSIAKTAPALDRQLGYLTMFDRDAGLAQSRISSGSVVILGVGGIGVVAVEHLVRAGIGSVTLIDFDKVEISNLNRHLLFSKADIGRSKIEAARDRLLQINPKLKVEIFDRFVNSIKDLQDVNLLPGDVLLIAIDRPRNIASELSDSIEQYGVKVMMGAVGLEKGFWGPFLVPGGHQLKCFEFEASEVSLEWARTAEPTPWSFGPTNTVIGAQIAHDVIQHLVSNWCPSLEKRIFVDFKTNEITRVPMKRCSSHN